MAELMLGAATVDITPPLGLPLSGWIRRDDTGETRRWGRELHQRLEARAMCFTHGDCTAVVVTLDLLGLSSEYCGKLRERVVHELGIPAEAVLLSCSHTHSGPMLPPWRPAGFDPPDQTYLAGLGEAIVAAITAARGRQVPVTVGFGRGSSAMAVNRRRASAGKVDFPPRADEDGSVDREVGVLRFDAVDGGVVAVMFSYGCHPTVGGPSEWVGPDYPGPARQAVEQRFPGGTAVFVLGNCGDVRAHYTNPDGTFRWDTTQALVEEAGAQLGEVAAGVAEAIGTSPTETLRVGRATRSVHTADDRLLEHSEFLAINFGPAALVSNPAECFSEIGLEVREATDLPLLFASVTNGFFGYVPTATAYPLGGYEVSMSWRSFGLSAAVRPDTHEEFREGMLAALDDCGVGT